MTKTAVTIHDDRVCTLGEGALWHPRRRQLFWFDIVGRQLLSRSPEGEPLAWQLDEMTSAAAWVDRDRLLLASETGLWQFDLATGARERLCELEADNPATRSNDGRADPWGGFWIGTMGKQAEKEAGAIYRYYRGELRKLSPNISIPNAICFSPAGEYAYFTDTLRQVIWRQPLEQREGWPIGEPEDFIDCKKDGVFPDGAVTDSAGRLWNAQWGSARVACYDPMGRFVAAVPFPASQVSCPAFGGADLKTLFATSATENMGDSDRRREPDAGKTFAVAVAAPGQAEYQVLA